MALNLHQPNLAGLAGIAGKYTNWNIAPTGALGLQALHQRNAQEESMRRDALAREQMQQQGELALRQQQIQRQVADNQLAQQERQGLLQDRELGLKEQQLGQQADQAQAELALRQQQLGQQAGMAQADQELKKQALFQQMQKEEMAKLLSEKKEKLQEKGSFASYALMSLNDAKTPEEAQMISKAIFKEAVEKKYITSDQAEQMLQMPLSQRKNLMKMQVMNLGMAKEFKDMQDKQSPTGSHVKMNADGSVEITQDLGTKAKGEAQKELMDREQSLKNLAPIRDEFKEKYFTFKNQAEIESGKLAEKFKGTPVLGSVAEYAAEKITGKSPEERSEDIKNATKYLNAVEQFFQVDYRKPITGAAAALTEIKDLRSSFLNKTMSPSEFLGALDGVVRRYTSDSEFNKNILREGLKTDPAKESSKAQAFRQQFGKDYSKEEIDAYIKKQGW